MAGDTGLTDVHGIDQLADRALAGAKRVDETAACGVGEDLKGVRHLPYITLSTYVVSTICCPKAADYDGRVERLTVGSVVVDCNDFRAMLAFWREALGYVERLLAIGATRHPRVPEPNEDFVALLDPEGNTFCVVDTTR